VTSTSSVPILDVTIVTGTPLAAVSMGDGVCELVGDADSDGVGDGSADADVAMGEAEVGIGDGVKAPQPASATPTKTTAVSAPKRPGGVMEFSVGAPTTETRSHARVPSACTLGLLATSRRSAQDTESMMSSVDTRRVPHTTGSRPIRRPLVWISVSVVVVLASSALWASRSLPSVLHANLYGEDALVFLQKVITDGPLVLFERFNGYLVVGIYALMLLASLFVFVFGIPFAYLGVIVAVISCLALGAISASPFLLLRRQMGVLGSLSAVAVLTFVPLYSADADVIGSIGNLKFAAMPLAVILVVYRWRNAHDAKRIIATDIGLFLLVLTNILVITVAVWVLLPNVRTILSAARHRDRGQLRSTSLISGVTLAFGSAVYAAIDLALGIPKYPGYLDSPYDHAGTIPLAYHSTVYAWLFPLGGAVTVAAMALVFVTLTVIAARTRGARDVYVLALWTAAIGTIGFVANRTGLSSLMSLGPSNDQFFYGQLMAFSFGCVYVFSLAASTRSRQVRLAVATLVFIVCTAPYGATFGEHARALLDVNGTFRSNVVAACETAAPADMLSIKVIPLATYVWQVPASIACR
jgi:hypothetical protein